MESYHEISVDMFGDHNNEMQVIQENALDQAMGKYQDEEVDVEAQIERAETVCYIFSSHNIEEI
jgi:hypothetical protein